MMNKDDIDLYNSEDYFECPEIFDITLNTFSSITDPVVTDSIKLIEVLDNIKCNVFFPPYKYIDNKKNPEYEKFKKKQRVVCYAAKFNERKNLNNLQEITNLMFLDMDFTSKEEAVNQKEYFITKAKDNNWDWLISCSLSLSRTGLHFIIWVDNIKSNDDYKLKFGIINKEYFEDKLDTNAKSITQFTILPWDTQIYINYDPNPLRNISGDNSNNCLKSNSISYTNTEDVYYKKSIQSNTYNALKADFDLSKKEPEGEIMSTPYTFSNCKIANGANKRKGKLSFTETLEDINFSNPNEPYYYREGRKVVKLNTYPFKFKQIRIGKRTSTLGAIALKLIYINLTNIQVSKIEYKTEIYKYLLWINNSYCESPLTIKEIENILDSNWSKYLNGKIDKEQICTLQRAFWSPESTLTPNEKRKYSCNLFYEPIRKETCQKIENSIFSLFMSGIKLTQSNIAKKAELNVQTVKKYWHKYKSLIKDFKAK